MWVVFLCLGLYDFVCFVVICWLFWCDVFLFFCDYFFVVVYGVGGDIVVVVCWYFLVWGGVVLDVVFGCVIFFVAVFSFVFFGCVVVVFVLMVNGCSL